MKSSLALPKLSKRERHHVWRVPQSEIVLYQNEDGTTRIQRRFEDETIWLTQKLMSELFQKDAHSFDCGQAQAEQDALRELEQRAKYLPKRSTNEDA